MLPTYKQKFFPCSNNVQPSLLKPPVQTTAGLMIIIFHSQRSRNIKLQHELNSQLWLSTPCTWSFLFNSTGQSAIIFLLKVSSCTWIRTKNDLILLENKFLIRKTLTSFTVLMKEVFKFSNGILNKLFAVKSNQTTPSYCSVYLH